MIFRKIKPPAKLRADYKADGSFARPQTFILSTTARELRVFMASSFAEARGIARAIAGARLDKLFWTSPENAAEAVRNKGAGEFKGVQINTKTEATNERP